MGAAGSVQAIYKDAASWFKTYFDSDLYVQDFQLMDKDNDGGITLEELQQWVARRGTEENSGGSWKIFLTNPQVLQYAHSLAAKRYGEQFASSEKKFFTISEFRTVLVQYFAISLLWVHFQNSEERSGERDLSLTFDEFATAVATFCESHEREAVNSEQMKADFAAMDTDNSGSLAFIEVCAYCCKFMDPQHNSTESDTAANSNNMQQLLQQVTASAGDSPRGEFLPNALRSQFYNTASFDEDGEMRALSLHAGSQDSVLSKASATATAAVIEAPTATAALDELAQQVQLEQQQAKLAEVRMDTNRELSELLDS